MKGRLGSSGIGSQRRRLLRAHRGRGQSGCSGGCWRGCARAGRSRSVSALRDWLGWKFRRAERLVDSGLIVSESPEPIATSCLYFEVPLFGFLAVCCKKPSCTKLRSKVP